MKKGRSKTIQQLKEEYCKFSLKDKGKKGSKKEDKKYEVIYMSSLLLQQTNLNQPLEINKILTKEN